MARELKCPAQRTCPFDRENPARSERDDDTLWIGGRRIGPAEIESGLDYRASD